MAAGGILTYHVAPRFDIAAKGGPLALGTVVTDLKRLVPLNRGEFRVEVPNNLKYAPVLQKNFNDTLAKARNANINGWLKACGLPLSTSANLGGSQDLESTISCESILTIYFDPDPAGSYIEDCLSVKPIQDWLAAANGHSANLYLVTGLKVARNLKFNHSKTAEFHGNINGSMTEPYTGAVEAGLGLNSTSENHQELKFEVDDIVIGIRFSQYHCVKRLFRKERHFKDKGILDGNMMDNQQDVVKESRIDFEKIHISEETAAREEASINGEEECWIARNV